MVHLMTTIDIKAENFALCDPTLPDGLSNESNFALSAFDSRANDNGRCIEVDKDQGYSHMLRASHINTVGCAMYEIEKLFESAPSDIASDLKLLFGLAEEQCTKRISGIKAVHALCVQSGTLDTQKISKAETFCIPKSNMSDSGPYALLSAFYDPPTQRAIRVDLNQRMAELLGMPLETAPALLEAHGRALVMPAWDCLCALVDASLHMSTTAVVRYFRMCSGHRRPCRPFLVCGSISKAFNAVGEVIQVPIAEENNSPM